MDCIFLKLKTRYNSYEAPEYYYELLVTTHNQELSKYFEEKYKDDENIVIIYRVYNFEGKVELETYSGKYDSTLPWSDGVRTIKGVTI